MEIAPESTEGTKAKRVTRMSLILWCCSVAGEVVEGVGVEELKVSAVAVSVVAVSVMSKASSGVSVSVAIGVSRVQVERPYAFAQLRSVGGAVLVELDT